MSDEEGKSGDVLYRYRFGSAEYDQARCELKVGGAVVPLEPRPLDVLAALLERPRQVLTHAELLQRFWAAETSDNVLSNAIGKLRRALGPDNAPMLQSMPRHGYMLDARVERVAVGRQFPGRLELSAGMDVPGREGYLLDRPLDPSGHRRVWLAVHRKTGDRRIFKFCSDGEQLAGLKREFTLYRALRAALGERNDIARVVDANFSRFPFYLECADGGENLPDWSREDGRLDAMSQDQRIGVFVGIARTVAAAHAVGILHKDLKPRNVLVAPAPAEAAGGTGQAWITRITDFGSGMLLTPDLLERLGVTRLGMTTAVVTDGGDGTVGYLAPELLEGAPPTVQSDLYALGVMLYQMLVGQWGKPMAPGWEADIGDELLREDIAAATQGRPSARLDSVAAWLQRLESLPARRTERAARREAAQRAQVAAEAARRARARRPWVIAAGVAMAAGLVGTSWQWRVAVRERGEALAAGERAAAIQAFLRDDVLGASDPFVVRKAAPLTVREAVATAAERVDQRFAGHPDTAADTAAALAGLMAQHQDFAAAEAQWARALPMLERAYGPADGRTQKARYEYVALLSRLGKSDRAATLLKQADAIAPGASEDVELVVLRHRIRGAVAGNQQRNAQAIGHLEKALAAAKSGGRSDSRLADGVYSDLIGFLWASGRVEPALALASEWTQSLERRSHPPELTLALARLRQGEALTLAGRPREAEPLVRSAVEGFTKGLGEATGETVMARNALCDVLNASQQLEESARCRIDLYQVAKRAPDIPPWVPPALLGSAGVDEYQLGRAAQAVTLLGEAVPALRGLPGGEGLGALMAYYLMSAQLASGDAGAARATFSSLEPQLLAAVKPEEPWPWRLKIAEGIAAALAGETARARELLDPLLAEVKSNPALADDPILKIARAAASRWVSASSR